MSAPVRFRGVFETVPGRATLRVQVPADLLAEAERIANELGEDRAVVLGDLVASALPAALAEAADDLVGAPARERLAGCLPPDAATPPAPTGGVTCESAPTSSPTASVAGPVTEPGATDGATVSTR